MMEGGTDDVVARILRVPIHTRVLIVSSLILAVGLTLGLALNANAHIPQPWNRLSSIIGWIYFCCWSVSFYPQIFLNYARKSVAGFSLDYAMLNFLGFLCYSIFNCAFYFSETVQKEYMRHHGGNPNAVEANDVVFSLHAALLIALTLFQCAIYPRNGQTISRATKFWSIGSIVVGVIFGLIVAFTPAPDNLEDRDKDAIFTTLNLLYYLSYIKLLTTLVKCLPQIALNYHRKSTVGWTIWNVLLDIAGGLLSVGQQVLDSAATNDWTAITGDPVKFGLGFVSIIVDIVFILQHYVLYAENNKYVEEAEETQTLLPKTQKA